MTITFHLNGVQIEIDTDPLEHLSTILLSRFSLTSIHSGCNEGGCGTCLVLLDNEPTLSCLLPAFQLKDRSVITFEGFKDSQDCEDIEKGFSDAAFHPCHIHLPGYIFLVHSLLEKTSHPEESDVASLLRGFHPICGGYSSLLEGIRHSAMRRFNRHNE